MSVLDLLAGLARANVVAAIAIAVVALLRKPVRRAFGARAAYLLWFAPVLAGAAGFVPPASTPAPLAPAMVMDAVVVAGGAVEAVATREPVLPALVMGLWIAGMAGAAAVLLWRQARFVATVKRREAGPAVVGAFHPRIVTPADFEDRFAADEREVILAHERAHLAAGDARINALAAAALCACWFNPLVHIGVYLMRLDQELACDAAVLGRFPKARRLYAEVLLKTQLATQPLPFGCHWPAAAEHPLKERIVMLKSPLPAPARRWAGVAAVGVLSATGAAAAWAAQPGQPAAPSALPPVAERACSAEEKALYDCKDGPGPGVTRIVSAPDAPSAASDASSVEPPQRASRTDLADPVNAPALAAPSAPAPGLWPDWVLRPDGSDVARVLARFYPTAAEAANQEGSATIACRVDGEGRLNACAVVKEGPEGAGFGAAALALAGEFQMKPLDKLGRPTAGQDVRIPFKFAIPSAR